MSRYAYTQQTCLHHVTRQAQEILAFSENITEFRIRNIKFDGNSTLEPIIIR